MSRRCRSRRRRRRARRPRAIPREWTCDRHLQRLSRARQLDAERTVIGPLAAALEKALEVDAARRPMSRHIAHRFHQPPGPAAIDMTAIGLLQHGPEIKSLVGLALVVMDLHMALEFRRAQLVQKGRGLRGLAQVIELPGRGRQFAERADHGQYRRDADAAGNEGQAAGIVHQRECVVRRRGGQHIAFPRLIDQADRAPAPLRVPLDGDDVAAALGRVIAQGILAQLAIGHPDRMCEPAVNPGSGAPSSRASSKERIPSAASAIFTMRSGIISPAS